MWRPQPCYQSRDTGQEPTATASSLLYNIDVDELRPSHQVKSEAETLGNHSSDFETRCEYSHGKLPPISTFFKQPQLQPHTLVEPRRSKRGRDWTGSEPVLPNCQHQGGGVAGDLLQVTGGQTFQQPFTGRGQQSLDPAPPTQTSAEPGCSGGRVTSANNQGTSTEQDDTDFLSKFWQDKSGYIKRPMNAFLVWSKIRRCALKEQSPGAHLADLSVYLGHEWSKLSEEEKSPYYEMAKRLKQIHKRKFPDYEYRPRKKKSKQSFPPRQTGGQGTTSWPIPSQSGFQGPGMNAWPAMMPHTAGCYCCPSFYQYIPMDPFSSRNIQSARVLNSSEHTCSTMREEANYQNYYPQMGDSNLASPYYNQQEHYMVYNHHEYMIGSNSTQEKLKPTGICTSQQHSTNHKMDCKCDDYVDVVGLH